MSGTVRPQSSAGDLPPEAETYRRAAREARAQADALRRAVVQADALVGQLEQLVESLLSILEYPKAYEWPALPPEGEAEPTSDAPTQDVTLVLDPDEQRRSTP